MAQIRAVIPGIDYAGGPSRRCRLGRTTFISGMDDRLRPDPVLDPGLVLVELQATANQLCRIRRRKSDRHLRNRIDNVLYQSFFTSPVSYEVNEMNGCPRAPFLVIPASGCPGPTSSPPIAASSKGRSRAMPIFGFAPAQTMLMIDAELPRGPNSGHRCDLGIFGSGSPTTRKAFFSPRVISSTPSSTTTCR